MSWSPFLSTFEQKSIIEQSEWWKSFSHKSSCFLLTLLTCVSLLEIDDPLVVKRFHDAVGKGDVSVIVKMLRDGVPVDCYYEDSRTALYWAVYYDGIDVVKVLLESGANVNRQDRNGRTPLIQAAINNNTDVMEVLLHHGADPSIVDVVERTALEWARMRYREEAIRLLEKY